jgi:hypothetical protein
MDLHMYLAERGDIRTPVSDIPPVPLWHDGYYWFLFRYFEAAKLQHGGDSLIDIYGKRELEGYLLVRFLREMERALDDVLHKPATWRVQTGWRGDAVSLEAERWEEVEKVEMLNLITGIIRLARGVAGSRVLFWSGV